MTPNQNLPLKLADDLTLSIRVKSGASNSNSTANEVQSIVEWTSINRMQLKFKNTWEMLLLQANPLRLYQLLWLIHRTETQSKVAGCTFSVRSV